MPLSTVPMPSHLQREASSLDLYSRSNWVLFEELCAQQQGTEIQDLWFTQPSSWPLSGSVAWPLPMNNHHALVSPLLQSQQLCKLEEVAQLLGPQFPQVESKHANQLIIPCTEKQRERALTSVSRGKQLLCY